MRDCTWAEQAILLKQITHYA